MLVHEKHVLQEQYNMLPIHIARHDSESSEVHVPLRERMATNHQGAFTHLQRKHHGHSSGEECTADPRSRGTHSMKRSF